MDKVIITSSIISEMIDDSIQDLIKAIKDKDNDRIFYYYGRSNAVIMFAYIGGVTTEITYKTQKKKIFNMVSNNFENLKSWY